MLPPGVQTVEAEVTVTADDTDALINTDLRDAPGPGAISIWLASTVADSQGTVQVGQKLLKSAGLIGKVGTNAQIDLEADSPNMTQVRGRERIRVSLDVVTAATIRCRAIWVGVPFG